VLSTTLLQQVRELACSISKATQMRHNNCVSSACCHCYTCAPAASQPTQLHVALAAHMQACKQSETVQKLLALNSTAHAQRVGDQWPDALREQTLTQAGSTLAAQAEPTVMRQTASKGCSEASAVRTCTDM
jgi:hypothetical protein